VSAADGSFGNLEHFDESPLLSLERRLPLMGLLPGLCNGGLDLQLNTKGLCNTVADTGSLLRKGDLVGRSRRRQLGRRWLRAAWYKRNPWLCRGDAGSAGERNGDKQDEIFFASHLRQSLLAMEGAPTCWEALFLRRIIAAGSLWSTSIAAQLARSR